MLTARFILAAGFAMISANVVIPPPVIKASDPEAPIAITQPEIDPAVAWTDALNDIDPNVRDQAADKLVKAGRASLCALGRAARSDLPEVQLRARDLLAQVSWDLPDDPYSIRWLIGNFGAHDLDHRQSIVVRLAAIQGNDSKPAWRALARIFVNDPDDSVRWQIASLAWQQVWTPAAAVPQTQPER